MLDKDIERFLKGKLQAILNVRKVVNNALPMWSREEQWVSGGVPKNCMIQCPARLVCVQKKFEYAQQLNCIRRQDSTLFASPPLGK